MGVTDEAIGHTVDSPDAYPVEPGAGVPASWPEAPAELKLPLEFPLRTTTETFNRRYSFVTRGGTIYVRSREDTTAPWRELPLPACIAGRVAAISADDDEMIALDDARRVYTMDNALKGAVQFSWSSRWGTPFWGGPGYALPHVRTWAWSVISPAEDETWTDPAGNETRVGRSKVSHIWGLRRGGQRLTFWDPWLPLDESYEMCGPHRGPLPRGQPVGQRLVRLRDRAPRRSVHPPLRLRPQRAQPALLQLLLRGPARQGRRRADPAAGGSVGRAAEDPRHDHLGDLHPQGRDGRDPPHPARRGPPPRQDGLLGARRRGAADEALAIPSRRTVP